MVTATILRGILRVVNAVADANRRKADREIALYLQRSGGKLTDNLERSLLSAPGRGSAR
jgi:hypothetical protein